MWLIILEGPVSSNFIRIKPQILFNCCIFWISLSFSHLFQIALQWGHKFLLIKSRIFRKVSFCRVKGFKFHLNPKDLEAIFPVSKFENSSFLLFQAMTGLNIPLVISSPIFLKTPRTVSSRTLLSIELGMPKTYMVFLRMSWRFHSTTFQLVVYYRSTWCTLSSSAKK